MTTITVRCSGHAPAGWTCRVTLTDGSRPVSSHEVRVRAADLRRLARSSADPTQLVERSFEFLLEREPPQSILRSFDLMEIARYFPDYEATITGRLRDA
jgi:hypothetical protein